MSDELKPCPFCGGEPEIYNPFHLLGSPRKAATYHGGVRCRDCGCESRPTTPPEKAIAAWNRRAQPAEEVQLMDHIIKHAVRGSTYQTVTSLNILVNAQILETQGRRAAIEAAIAAKDTP